MLCATAMSLAALCLISSPTANASPGTSTDRSNTPIARANPQIPRGLLDSLPASILNESGIHVDPTIEPGTSFVIAGTDGKFTVAPGQSIKQMKAAARSIDDGNLTAEAASCRTSVVVPVGVTNMVVKSSCTAVIGANDSAKVTYTVSDGNTSGTTTWRNSGTSVAKQTRALSDGTATLFRDSRDR
jgi:hypothetical protein